MTRELEYRALGPFEVLRERDPIELGPHKQRSLLAFLLINANRVVSKDRITEAMWGADASDKENALWVYVSRLRTVLEPERSGRGQSTVLLTKDPGYVLSVDPQRVDLLRFEQALGRARSLMETETEKALLRLDEAIECWRGEAFADFAYESWARAEIDRLDELRLEAVELRFDAMLRLGHAADLISGLESLSRENPLRERPVAQLMTALYRAGRQAEALRAFERHRRTIAQELGIEPSPDLRRLEEQILLHDERLAPREEASVSPTSAEIRNPYKGLHAFQETDAEDFFGRDALIAELLRRLDQGDRLVALVGPSGSGKSSVVRAGLVPRMRKGGTTGRQEWVIAQMVPGAHPFAELEAALLRSRLDGPDSLPGLRDDDSDAILRAALRLLPGDHTRMLLVIDQFEELFTLVEDRALQQRFLDALLVAVDDPHGRLTLVVTLRADFYDRPLLHPAFGARLGNALVNVTPLSANELEEAASEPVATERVRIEPAMLGRLIGDVVDHPGALPMFQYTLTELFDRRSGDVLTEASYDEIGGVRGAITHRAEDLFAELGPEERVAARQLFLRLVSMSGEDTWSRRRVRAEEIISLDVDVVALQAVIDRFGSRRLLFFDRDRATGAPTVEVGHEALLSEWDRLDQWIREARTDLLRHASFTAAVDDWERSGRDPGYLVAGARLAEYERWAGSSRLELNARELQFLGASLEARAVEVRADRQRTERETQLARRARRRLWAAATAVVLLVVGGVVIALAILRGPDEVTKVALVTDGEDNARNALLARGVQQAAAEFPVEITELKPPITDLKLEYRRLAETGVELIIVAPTVGHTEVNDVAPLLPDVRFVLPLADPATIVDGPTAARFAEKEAGFLAGVAAASETATGVVGFVGGMAVEVYNRQRGGFEAGVASVDPDVVVLARNISSNGDAHNALERPDLGKAAAADLFARNADVVYHAAEHSGLGIFAAARESTEETGIKRWGIGSDSDQILEVDSRDEDYVLLSVVRKYDVLAYDVVRDYVNKDLDEDIVRYALADGGLGYSTRGGNVSARTVSEIEAAEAGLIDGSIDFTEIPDGDLLPPLEAPDPVGTLEITYRGGSSCTYRFDGEQVLGRGQSIRVAMNNESTDWASVLMFPPHSGEAWYAASVPADPGTSRAGFVVGEDAGDWQLWCGGPADGGSLTTIPVR